jgi:UDP-glucuronate 4-epimerase
MKVLVTGNAGFIGFHTSKRLLEEGHLVIGLDNLNNYYDVSLKKARLSYLEKTAEITRKKLNNNYSFFNIELKDKDSLSQLFRSEQFDTVIHLAAQAGVRYSLTNPSAYIESNIMGFLNILESCRHNEIKHLTYASTSSVYGSNTDIPFKEDDSADHPIQLYASTKRSNELMAHSYSYLFNLPTSGLRFFTVYGPWGRPDMALFKFTKGIIEGLPIEIYNEGKHTRDFTYVDDIVNGIISVNECPAEIDANWDSSKPNPSSSNCPYRILNIGNNKTVELMTYISALENELGKKARKNFLPLQEGDIQNTASDTSKINTLVGFKAKTDIEEGIRNFVKWYKDYYNIK